MTIIIPTYKEPEYLDICLESLFTNQVNKNRVIVVVDGFLELNKSVLDKYPDVELLVFTENLGMMKAINAGVNLVENDWCLIVNDDNVFPVAFDSILTLNVEHLQNQYNKQFILTPNQIESSPSIFSQFICKDFGQTAKDFNLYKFSKGELIHREDAMYQDGWTFPFIIHSRVFKEFGGFDENFPGPHVVDLDFFHRLGLENIIGARTHYCNFYHFGGKATKSDVDTTNHFNDLERKSMEFFKNKWGKYPFRNKHTNKIS